MRAERRLRTWRDEAKPLKTNATGGCLAYHTESLNEYVRQQVNILAGHHELLLSTVASYHGLAMSAVTISCQKSYNREHGIRCRGRNQGKTKSKNGQTSHCRRCCASQTTEVDGWPLQRTHLSEYPNNDWESWVWVKIYWQGHLVQFRRLSLETKSQTTPNFQTKLREISERVYGCCSTKRSLANADVGVHGPRPSTTYWRFDNDGQVEKNTCRPMTSLLSSVRQVE